MSRSRLVALLVLSFSSLPSVVSAATLSMQEFLATQPRWEALAESGKTFRIEGRVASASDRLVRLQKCPLPFRPEEGTLLPELKRAAAAVEMTGRLGRRSGELVFFVEQMKELPGDAQSYALRQSAIDAGDPADWYALADWAVERGGFYEDRFLLEKAAEARHKGLALERQAAAENPAILDVLAAKADSFGLADAKQELAHESLRARWERLRKQPKSEFDPLLEEIRARLPGAATKLDAWPMDVAARYAAEPLATYNRASSEEGPVLDRLFLAEVQLAAIERHADPAGSNGDTIADQIAAALPERADLAERYRLREIEYRIERIELATRSEALELARRLEERDRDREAKRALAAWLAAREAAARDDGVAALVPVAEDYASVLGDKPNAARLLVEVLKETPESSEIPAKLKQLGYVKVDGVWITKEEAATRPADPVTLAMSQGRVAVGMSPEQVRKTLGKPDRVARAASSTQIHEAWVYGVPGRSGLTVHFLRYAARGPEDARVVGLGTASR